MDIEFRTDLTLTLYGVQMQHDETTCYGEEIRLLLDRLWGIVKKNGYDAKGINHVLYGEDGTVFLGVEINGATPDFDRKDITLNRYAHYKHVGSYAKLGDLHEVMRQTIVARGKQVGWPAMEIYGDWAEREEERVTEIVYPVK